MNDSIYVSSKTRFFLFIFFAQLLIVSVLFAVVGQEHYRTLAFTIPTAVAITIFIFPTIRVKFESDKINYQIGDKKQITFHYGEIDLLHSGMISRSRYQKLDGRWQIKTKNGNQVVISQLYFPLAEIEKMFLELSQRVSQAQELS